MTFSRLSDRRPVETLVERDDGVVFAMRGAGGGADLPHDAVHAVVEQHLRMREGIWGCVADGVVWGSMRHVSGRQPPHATERSARLKKERAAAIRRAELLADLVHRLASGEEALRQEMAIVGVPEEQLQSAATELRAATARWAALAPGATWDLEWDCAGRDRERTVARGRRRDHAHRKPGSGRRANAG